MKIKCEITSVKPNFRESFQYGSKCDKFDMQRVREICARYKLKCKFMGTGIFIGSQLESISRDTFVSLYGALDYKNFGNNDWETLLSNAEQGILNGFAVYSGI